MMYDIAVIGGGAIGCAVLQTLTSHGYCCILLEKNDDLVSGASSGNSGMLHTGFDTSIGTIEFSCVERARKINPVVFRKFHLPHKELGALMIAWTKEEQAKFPIILKKAKDASIEGVREITRTELFKLEPHLSREVIGALWIPGESVVDPWLTLITLAHHARRAGAEIEHKCKVTSGTQLSDKTWTLATSRGPIRARCVINAAGLHGDTVDFIANEPKFRIHPMKGQFAVFDRSAGQLVRHLIIPIPTETKGVIVFPTVYGNVVVGPTAEPVSERDTATVNTEVTKNLVSHALKVVPALEGHEVVGSYAGIRPATNYRDYQINAHPDKNWVTVAGIRSTGLTSCLAIAEHVHHLVLNEIGQLPSNSLPPPQTVTIPWMTSNDSAVFDGAEYKITHGITKFGLQAKL